MITRMMTLLLIFLCSCTMAKTGYGQLVTITCKEEKLAHFFKRVEKQTGYTFFYNDQVINNAGKVTLSVKNVPLKEVLKKVLTPNELEYVIEEQLIIISKSKTRITAAKTEQAVIESGTVKAEINLAAPPLRGTVRDENNEVISGVSVVIAGTKKGTATNNNGLFVMEVEMGQTIEISAVGYQTQRIAVTALLLSKMMEVKLVPSVATGENVVVNTGLFSRRRENFTGATTTFTGSDLRNIGNLNVIQSLKSLDPSFLVIENNAQGSNPNVTPTIELRGKTSLSAATLRDEFSEDPNQPLFILDGFPTTLQRIVDLDINRIESVTLLKDAASTAIYGARAANGVVVIETIKPRAGELSVNYTADFTVQVPDLSDYNLMNAAEKLEFERQAGRYTFRINSPLDQIALDQLYNNKLQEVKRDVNTYWMNEPLRTAIANGHSIQVSGGSREFMFTIGGNYKRYPGVMKGSGRNTYGGNIDLTYRKGKFSFINRFNLNGANADESPYGSFSLYSRANPYYRKYNEDGSIPKYLERSMGNTINPSTFSAASYDVFNPLFDAQFNTINNTVSYQLQNQLSLIYSPSNEWRFSAAGNVTKNTTSGKNFAPPELTRFDAVDLFRKGTYTKSTTESNSFQLNVQAAYAKVINKNRININLQGELQHNDNNREIYSAVGFPAGSNGNPVFSFGYPTSGKPSYTNAVSRRNNLLLAVNYAFDDTYFADINGRMDGSTAFGSARKYTPFWSVGVGWNLHKNVLSGIKALNLLRLKGSIGYTGNQNIGSTSSTSTYTFEQSVNYFGQGIMLTTLGNAGLRWQKTLTTNISIDYGLLGNRISGYVNIYEKNTDPLVVVLDLPASTGVYGYGTNAGQLNTRGIEYSIRYAPIYRLKERIVWTIGINGTSTQSEYSKFGSNLAGIDKKLVESKSLTRYRDGYSPDDIWAVPSLGIDPATGREIFLKTNGQQTFDYSTDDIIRIGNGRPKLEGVINNTVNYKGISLGLFIRYRYGGDLFNTVLYGKVENISIEGLKSNQDKRALHERWQRPGDVTQFKSISSTSSTPASSRFIQDNNMLIGESISLGWQMSETYNPWLKKLHVKNLNLTVFANDIFRWATTLNERGIDYPFSRNVSIRINASF
jgi:TonB-linked SusC/RagA family outer membrane protein